MPPAAAADSSPSKMSYLADEARSDFRKLAASFSFANDPSDSDPVDPVDERRHDDEPARKDEIMEMETTTTKTPGAPAPAAIGDHQSVEFLLDGAKSDLHRRLMQLELADTESLSDSSDGNDGAERAAKNAPSEAEKAAAVENSAVGGGLIDRAVQSLSDVFSCGGVGGCAAAAAPGPAANETRKAEEEPTAEGSAAEELLSVRSIGEEMLLEEEEEEQCDDEDGKATTTGKSGRKLLHLGGIRRKLSSALIKARCRPDVSSATMESHSPLSS